MTNLLLTGCAAAVAFVVNCVAWFMAGRRQLYVLRLDVRRACLLAFLEDLAPYLSVGGLLLVPTPLEKVVVMLCGATGGAIGLGIAMLVEKNRRKEDKK